jgi:hypothetical protein
MPAKAFNMATSLLAFLQPETWTGINIDLRPKETEREQPRRTLQESLSQKLSALFDRNKNIDVQDARSGGTSEEIIASVLGQAALTRFSELRKIRAGWNFGEGLPMSSAAELNLLFLLSKLGRPIQNPRLFLMDDGGIELQWKDSSSARISIVATETEFELYMRGSTEKRFELRDYNELLKAALNDQIAA